MDGLDRRLCRFCVVVDWCWYWRSVRNTHTRDTTGFIYVHQHTYRDALFQGGFGAAVLGLAVGGVVAAPMRPAQAFPFGGGDDVASGLDDIAKARAKVEEGEFAFGGFGDGGSGIGGCRIA